MVRVHSLLKGEATRIGMKHCNGKPWAQAVLEARFLAHSVAGQNLGANCNFLAAWREVPVLYTVDKAAPHRSSCVTQSSQTAAHR